MNRILKRPMFRIGGSAGTGITSGLDKPKRGLVDEPGKYSQDPEDRAYKTDVGAAIDAAQVVNDPRIQRTLFSTPGGFGPGSLGGFLTSFGLDLLKRPPVGSGFGGLLATAAGAAEGPFQTFQAAQLARADDRSKFAQDLFMDELQGQRDIAEAREKAGSEIVNISKQKQAADAIAQIYQTDINKILSKIDELEPITDKGQIEDLNKQIEVIKEKSKADQLAIYQGAQTDQEYQRELILKLVGAGETLEDILVYFPDAIDIMGPGFKFPEREEGKTGGRMGYRDGTKMMESIVEQEKEQGEVQDLSYTQLRARLPNEISNEIVMLLANSKQALLDFANIQTTQDIQSFNQQYDVNLTLPQGA
jgi:hypothetical protein